jgi:hypothetical protein
MADGKKKWIKDAIKHPGAMTEAAKREGVSNSAYIEEHKHDSGRAGQRARLAETLKGMHHKHHQATTPHSKIRNSFYGKKG